MWAREVGKRRAMTRTLVIRISFKVATSLFRSKDEYRISLSVDMGCSRSLPGALCCRPASVDGDYGSVDELGLRGAEISNEGGYILRRAEAADGRGGYQFRADFFFFMGVIFVEVALDEGRLH